LLLVAAVGEREFRARRREWPSERHRGLTMAAGFLRFAGWAILILGVIGVIAMAAALGKDDTLDPGFVVAYAIGLFLSVVLLAGLALGAAYFFDLALDVADDIYVAVDAYMDDEEDAATGDDLSLGYTLDEWSSDERARVSSELVEADIPYRWDGVTLQVAEAHEALVDRILDDVEGRAADEPR
jgi:hypothetical protein